MALIQCPECNKEISDKVKTCPHCGYPFEENSDKSNNIQQVEISAVNISPKDPVKTKKTIVGVVSVFVVLALMFAIFIMVKSSNEKKAHNTYIDTLEITRTTMLEGGSQAESLLNLTAQVWFNSIFEERDPETDKYTMSGGSGFNDDFNESLNALMTDSSTLTTISLIEANQTLVDGLMKELQDPPNGLEDSYETALELYTVYKGLTDLAISPSGSLETFAQNKSQKIDRFLELYEKLETQTPEKK